MIQTPAVHSAKDEKNPGLQEGFFFFFFSLPSEALGLVDEVPLQLGLDHSAFPGKSPT